MAKMKTYKSTAFAAIHETATGMYDAGVLDKKTMRRFDNTCLAPVHDFTGNEAHKDRPCQSGLYNRHALVE